MPAWIHNGFLLWPALIGVCFTLPIWRRTIAPGRLSFVRQLAGGAALTMAWAYLIVGAEVVFGVAK
jgi:hypothetical protein